MENVENVQSVELNRATVNLIARCIDRSIQLSHRSPQIDRTYIILSKDALHILGVSHQDGITCLPVNEVKDRVKTVQWLVTPSNVENKLQATSNSTKLHAGDVLSGGPLDLGRKISFVIEEVADAPGYFRLFQHKPDGSPFCWVQDQSNSYSTTNVDSTLGGSEWCFEEVVSQSLHGQQYLTGTTAVASNDTRPGLSLSETYDGSKPITPNKDLPPRDIHKGRVCSSRYLILNAQFRLCLEVPDYDHNKIVTQKEANKVSQWWTIINNTNGTMSITNTQTSSQPMYSPQPAEDTKVVGSKEKIELHAITEVGNTGRYRIGMTDRPLFWGLSTAYPDRPVLLKNDPDDQRNQWYLIPTK
ncbi:hypothetical protein BD410DRAFT_831043 [Rickenella mellea]|uniref:Ricin B lectin domain-containing protein n=1 Tax=Rickenella mellea TaxID=50990 RepID=A0A4Y7PSZ7_9AGAM|nr:hypothetical protein BD410DRAFT_831043 [Rickenella mellea]